MALPLLAARSASGTAARPLGHLNWPCSLRFALLRGVDVTGVAKKSLLRLLGEHCADAGEQRTLLHWSSRGGREAYAQEVRSGGPAPACACSVTFINQQTVRRSFSVALRAAV